MMPILETNQRPNVNPLSRKHRKGQTRSQTSCFPCRARKARCGSLPPGPCAYCTKHSIACTWPNEDRRTTRYKTRQASSQSPPRDDESVEISPPTLDATVSPSTFRTWTDLLEPKWADHAGSHGSFDLAETSFPRGSHQGSLDLPGPSVSLNYGNESFKAPVVFEGPADVILGSSADDTSETLGPVLNLDLPNFPSSSRKESNPTTNGTVTAEETPAWFLSLFSLEPDKRTAKIRWRRHHGRSAYVPGSQQVVLNVQVRPTPEDPTSFGLSPLSAPEPSHGRDLPWNVDTMRHLLRLFTDNFGSQFPYVDHAELDQALQDGTGSAFLFNCIAAMAARFSTDPRIVQSNEHPHAYGNVFFERAKNMIGSVLRIPLRETVMGFVLLSHCALSAGLWSEIWMLCGIAVSMAYDLALHILPEGSDVNEREARQDRLIFWNVMMLDFMVSLGVGRPTSMRLDTVTQAHPTQMDVCADGSSTPSPFPFLTRLLFLSGQLFNLVNIDAQYPETNARIDQRRTDIMQLYHELPSGLQWNVLNLRQQVRDGQGSLFVYLHTWAIAVLALAGPEVPPSSLNLSGARSVVEIITMCDIMDPTTCLTLPFIGQALYLAGSVLAATNTPTPDDTTGPANANSFTNTNSHLKDNEFAHSLRSSSTLTQIGCIRQILTKLSSYWLGVDFVIGTLDQKINGGDVDLSSTENTVPTGEVYDWALPRKYQGEGAHVN